MARLDIQRQKELEPKRMAHVKREIEKKGYQVIPVSDRELQFEHTMWHNVKL